MEEDIKILEDYIKLIKKGYCLDCNELCNIYTAPVFPSGVVALSLENLIKRYRELKEREIWSTATINVLKRDFIQKSKIKEKIEELEEKKLKEPIASVKEYSYHETIKVLQELMDK